MNNKYQYAGVGFFFLIGAAMLYLVLQSLSEQRRVENRGYRIEARFDDVLQLRRGDEVRMSGVRVGSVQDIFLDGGEAVALLGIENKYRIPEDSVAKIALAGLLGTNFVAIQLGDLEGPTLTAGSRIRTEASYDFNRIMGEIGNVAEGIGGALDDFGGLFSGEGGPLEELMGLVRANREGITRTVANLEAITGQIAEGEGTLGKLLFSDEGYNQLLGAVKTIESAAANANEFLTEVRSVVGHVSSGEGLLGRLLYDDKAANDLEQTLASIREFTATLNNPNSTIGRLLNDDSLYLEARNTVRKANRTLDSIGDSAPFSALGLAASALF